VIAITAWFALQSARDWVIAPVRFRAYLGPGRTWNPKLIDEYFPDAVIPPGCIDPAGNLYANWSITEGAVRLALLTTAWGASSVWLALAGGVFSSVLAGPAKPCTDNRGGPRLAVGFVYDNPFSD